LFLASRDWNRQKEAVCKRDRGRCQWVIMEDFLPGIPMICGKEANHAHHMKRRGEGGDDSMENLVAICAKHHREAHPEKQVRLRSITA